MRKKKDRDEYSFIYDNGDDSGIDYSDPVEDVQDETEMDYAWMNDPSYEEIYTEDGDGVMCDLCGGEMRYHDGNYMCPSCGQVMDRGTYFNYIGAEPPGPECTTCENIYPGCLVCPYGYVDDDEDF